MKQILFVTSLFGILLITTGCIKKDTLEDIHIYTTVYPIEYITEQLYGKHSKISSIYPDGVNPEAYELTNKQIRDYSKEDMYIFDGLSKEKEHVNKMFQFNKNLMIIDTTLSMEMINGREELWLDPSNFLMLALNVKNGLLEYITNHYLKTEIEENYEDLKLEISNIDAKLKLLSETSDNQVIVADTDTLKFLEKYGFIVISLEENENLLQKTIGTVKTMIAQDKVKYIFTLNESNLNETTKRIVTETNIKVLELHDMATLSEKERSEKENYITLLNENIETLKNELYH